MRNCKKNQRERPFIGINFLKEIPIVDDDGYKTGSTKIIYSDEYMFKGHISSAKGQTQVEMFGNNISYDKIIVMNKRDFINLKITETSVLFVDVKPTYSNDIPIYDYRIKKIAETINEVALAIEKVRNDEREEE